MFRVLEKDGKRMPVYSRDDLEYMQRRGWSPVTLEPPRPSPETVPETHVKRKYTRRK